MTRFLQDLPQPRRFRRFGALLGLVLGLGIGLGAAQAQAAFSITKAEWKADKATLQVEGRAPGGAQVAVSNATDSAPLGSATADRKGRWKLQLRRPTAVPCRVAAEYAGAILKRDVAHAPRDCDTASTPPGEPQMVSLSVAGPAEVPENSGAQYRCVASYSDGSTRELASGVAWSEDSAHAAIDSRGYLSTGAVEQELAVRVSARYGDASGSLAVTIRKTSGDGLVSVFISGPEAVTEGDRALFSLSGIDASGATIEIREGVDWQVSDPALASVDATGALTAAEVDGEATVSLSAAYTDGAGTHQAAIQVRLRDRAEPVTGSHAGRFSAFEGTRTCLECHQSEATDMHASVHYQWKGDASETVGLSADPAGKLGGINDFCIYPDINWIGKLTNVAGTPVDGGCAKCHTGLGDKPTPEATQEQLENIDCLVCHSQSYERTVGVVDGRYRFVPDTAKMTVSLLQAATDITRPDSGTCLDCHTKAGGGNNFKRGDIEEAHRNPSRSFDVHMAPASAGGAGLKCTDCHTTAAHRIAGRGVDLRPRDNPDEVSCAKCHGAAPHSNERLDRHTARVNCTVCHIPAFAKVAATDMFRDWSKPGDLVQATGLYEPHHEKGVNVTPVYRFFNGTSRFYEFGAPAETGADGAITMAGPLGSVTDPGAKIHAFKHHRGYQPIDPATGRLLPLKIGKFFESGRIEEAVALGAAGVGWDVPAHEFAKTERYLGLYHEVAPKEQALDCASCHGGTRMDFPALGYEPVATRNGRPLCASCHGDKSDEWQGTEYFFKLHDKHVRDKRYDCQQCHAFASAN